MQEVLGEVEPDGNGWKVVITSEALVEAMNRQLGLLAGTLPQISKRPGTVSSYHIQPSAYGRLCEHLGIDPKAHPA